MDGGSGGVCEYEMQRKTESATHGAMRHILPPFHDRKIHTTDILGCEFISYSSTGVPEHFVDDLAELLLFFAK